jgi:hypothetical protein
MRGETFDGGENALQAKARAGRAMVSARAKAMWEEYRKSNSAGDVPARCPKRLVLELLGCDPTDVAERREKGQAVLNMLCLTSRIQTIPFRVVPGRPSYDKGYYDYDKDAGLGRSVTVYNSPSMSGEPVDGESFLETLCHEFCHHWDVQALKLKDCYHTPGFYRRVENLYRKLTS